MLYLHTALSLLIYIEKVSCKFKRDITFIQLKTICEIMFKKRKCIYEERPDYMVMNLNADNSDDIKLMKLLSKFRLPDLLEKLTIEGINCNVYKILSLFIENSFPTSLEKLTLEWSSIEEFNCSLLPSITIAVSKVLGQIDLHSVTINKEEFEHLLLDCNSKYISFRSCVINLPCAPDLSSISKSNIRGLQFNFKEIDVKPDLRWFELLAEGISKSKGIVDSLRYISFCSCDIKKEEAQEVIQRFEMNRVRVRVY